MAAILPVVCGIFFDNIYFAADVRLYAGLIKNGSFEFPMPMMGLKESLKNYQKDRILVTNKSNGN